ncbi:MAG: hypothetical protein QOF95_294, partial [Pseudonocardiales bacterium]|nr:hypothetical protein [Pseudonocardiales bacterium]
PGKSVEGASWVGRVEAEAEIVESRKRLERSQASTGTTPTGR